MKLFSKFNTRTSWLTYCMFGTTWISHSSVVNCILDILVGYIYSICIFSSSGDMLWITGSCKAKTETSSTSNCCFKKQDVSPKWQQIWVNWKIFCKKVFRFQRQTNYCCGKRRLPGKKEKKKSPTAYSNAFAANICITSMVRNSDECTFSQWCILMEAGRCPALSLAAALSMASHCARCWREHSFEKSARRSARVCNGLFHGTKHNWTFSSRWHRLGFNFV